MPSRPVLDGILRALQAFTRSKEATTALLSWFWNHQHSESWAALLGRYRLLCEEFQARSKLMVQMLEHREANQDGIGLYLHLLHARLLDMAAEMWQVGASVLSSQPTAG